MASSRLTRAVSLKCAQVLSNHRAGSRASCVARPVMIAERPACRLRHGSHRDAGIRAPSTSTAGLYGAGGSIRRGSAVRQSRRAIRSARRGRMIRHAAGSPRHLPRDAAAAAYLISSDGRRSSRPRTQIGSIAPRIRGIGRRRRLGANTPRAAQNPVAIAICQLFIGDLRVDAARGGIR